MQTLSTHQTRSSASKALSALLGSGFVAIAHETYRAASGRVLALRLGNEWEIVELTAVEARHAEINALFSGALDLEEQAADHDARAEASVTGRGANVRFAAEKRAKAAELRKRAEALVSAPVRSVKPVSKVA